MNPVSHAVATPARMLAALALATVAVVAVPAVAQAATFADDFNRENNTDIGAGWTEGGSGVEIVDNALRTSNSGLGYALQPASNSTSYSVDARKNNGFAYVALLAGGSGTAEDFAFVKVQTNTGGNNFDSIYFYRGNNGSGGMADGSNYYVIIPAEDQFTSARMDLSVEGAVATLTLDTDFDGSVDLTYSATYATDFPGTVGGIGLLGAGIADNFGGVAAVALEETTITGSTDPSTPTYGDGNLVLTVDSDSEATPTGSVEVTIGDQEPTTIVLVDGVANVSLDSLNAGTYTYSATYSGDDLHLTSSTESTFEVAPAPTETAVTFSPDAPAYGSETTLTATVSSEAGTPPGDVTFMDGTAELGNVTLVDGIATLTVPSFTPGEHAITADYLGTVNYAVSGGGATVAVAKGASTTALTAPAAAVEGEDVALSATVTPPTGVTESATGAVEFFAGTTSLGTATIVDGVATLTTDAIPAGDVAVSAVYSGDDLLEGSSAEANIAVAEAPVTATPEPEVSADPTPQPTEEGTGPDSGELAEGGEAVEEELTDDELSITGADVGTLVAGSAALLLAGGIATALARRRINS